MRIRLLTVVSLALAVGFAGVATSSAKCRRSQDEYLLADGFQVRDYCLVSLKHRHLNFYRDIPVFNADGSLNAVNEIPAGTNAKFEVAEDTGKMCWEFKDGAPRLIKFLGYPANYGMIPRTIAGDGDSLDIVTLGAFERRGEIVHPKIIGVLRLIDGSDVDDKIIAVLPDTPLSGVNSIAELDAQFPGASTIIETWFVSYKGPNELSSGGFGGPDEAMVVLQNAMADYQP
jgi:inorganic pyrophosphatase